MLRPDTAPAASFIGWAADGSMTFDLGVGDSLPGFSFNASQRVGVPITFALNGSAKSAVAVKIPEPGTLG